MAKASHRPDKELWSLYKIRILSETGEKLNKDIDKWRYITFCNHIDVHTGKDNAN